MDDLSLIINGTVSAIQAPIVAIGNLTVFATILLTKSLKTNNNYLILQLCLCDLLRGAILASIKAYSQISRTDHPNGFMCQITGVVSCLSYLQSPATLMIIAVLHYTCIVKSKYFKRLFTRKRVFLYGVCTFLVNLIVALLPVFHVGQYQYSSAHGMCFTDWSSKQIIFRSLFYILTFGIYYPPIVFCYLQILIVIKKHSRNIGPGKRIQAGEMRVIELSNSLREVKDGNSSGLRPTESTQELTGEQRKDVSRRLGMVPKYETEVTMVMFVIIVAYFVCWFPAFFLTVASISVRIPGYLEDTFITLIDIKAMLNPFIYAFQSRRFRRAFLALVKKKT